MQYPTTVVLPGSNHRRKGSFGTMLPSFLPLQQVNTGRPWKRASPPAKELHRDLGLQTPCSSGCSRTSGQSPESLFQERPCVPFLEREEAWEIQGLWQGLTFFPPCFCLSLCLSGFMLFPQTFPQLPVSWHSLSNCRLNSLKHLHCSLWYNENFHTGQV